MYECGVGAQAAGGRRPRCEPTRTCSILAVGIPRAVTFAGGCRRRGMEQRGSPVRRAMWSNELPAPSPHAISGMPGSPVRLSRRPEDSTGAVLEDLRTRMRQVGAGHRPRSWGWHRWALRGCGSLGSNCFLQGCAQLYACACVSEGRSGCSRGAEVSGSCRGPSRAEHASQHRLSIRIARSRPLARPPARLRRVAAAFTTPLAQL
jgi:hypothetical protein